MSRRGYERRRGLLSLGVDGSIDPSTAAGRLALSALNRIVVGRDRLIAASTSAFARSVDTRDRSLASDTNLAAAASALGPVTAAAFFPASGIQPASGVLIVPLATRKALVLALGVDDRGRSGRMFKLALFYGARDDAQADAAAFEEGLAAASLPSQQQVTFSDLLSELEVGVVADRTVLVTGALRSNVNSGFWRGLVENGDIAVLVRP